MAPHRRPADRQTRRRHRARLLCFGVLAGLVAAAAAAVVSGDYQVRPVLSGSMRPGLPVGGLVIAHRIPIGSLQVRDVVVFRRPDRPAEIVVHRVVSLSPGPAGPVARTQGDANDATDPWQIRLHGPTAYRAAFSVPLLGYPAVWVHGPTGRRTLLAAGLLLMVLAVGSGVVSRRRPALADEPRRSLDIPATPVA